VDGDPVPAQHRREPVVLLLRPLRPQHVLEQQVAHRGRRQPLELDAGPVQDDVPQDADLRVDSESRHPPMVPP
jgi:hypothetical protein